MYIKRYIVTKSMIPLMLSLSRITFSFEDFQDYRQWTEKPSENCPTYTREANSLKETDFQSQNCQSQIILN